MPESSSAAPLPPELRPLGPSTRAPARMAEFTLRAVITGVLLGVVFGAANAYLGLRVGFTISASIPAAVMTVTVFRLTGRRASLLETNMSQTIGSASTALATGTIFTIPALFLWGMVPSYFQIVTLCFLGGVLGLCAMIPLRRMLIVDAAAELPYPEGAACAEVLRATDTAAPGNAWIFRGIAVGAVLKICVALLFFFPSEVSAALPFLPKAQLALELAPALMAVGFILGYRQSAVVVAGSIVSSLVLIPLIAYVGADRATPLAPATSKLISAMSVGEIWSQYVRYIGAGAVAMAGILTVLRNLPSMASAFAAVLTGLRRRSGRPAGGDEARDVPETERDLPGVFVLGEIGAVILVSALVPGVFAGDMGPVPRAVCAAGVALFGVLFVAVAARIVGIVGVSSQPTSGITLVTLIGVASLFAVAGWTTVGARAAVLTVGTIVAIAASKAGDISQDLKTGYLVGATPARQQLGQLIGAAFACWAVAGTIFLLQSAYGFGSTELPAPQATLMKTIIEGVLAGSLPWGLVLTGAGVSLGAILCGVSGLAFAIGVYLPLASMAAIYLGGCVRALADGGARAGAGGGGESAGGEANPGILAASGLVAGEGLAGVLVAGLRWARIAHKSLPDGSLSRIPGGPGEAAALAVIGLVCWFLVAAQRSQRSAAASPL